MPLIESSQKSCRMSRRPVTSSWQGPGHLWLGLQSLIEIAHLRMACLETTTLREDQRLMRTGTCSTMQLIERHLIKLICRVQRRTRAFDYHTALEAWNVPSNLSLRDQALAESFMLRRRRTNLSRRRVSVRTCTPKESKGDTHPETSVKRTESHSEGSPVHLSSTILSPGGRICTPAFRALARSAVMIGLE